MPHRVRLLAVLLVVAGVWPSRRVLGDESRSVAQAAAVLAQARDPGARAGAALVLGRVAEPASQPAARAALVRALVDPSASVRRHVAVALTALPVPLLRQPLEAALARETQTEVVPALLLALGALHQPALVELLASFRRDVSPVVRAAAATALGDAGSEAARLALLAMLADPAGPDVDWSVRGSVILALGRAGRVGDSLPVLAAMRAAGGWDCWLARTALAAALPRIDAAPRPRLDVLVLDPDERVALTAAQSILRVEGEPALLALFAHPGPSVRTAAAGASAQGQVLAARPQLVALAYGDANLRARWSAALALFRLNLPEGDELVLAGLKSSEPTVWAEALAVLEQRTGVRHGTDIAAWRRALLRWRQQGRQAQR